MPVRCLTLHVLDQKIGPMLTTFVLALFLGLSAAVTPIKSYSTQWNGVEVINLRKPALGYAANLNYNQASTSTNKTLFFTADKSNPNLFTAGVTGRYTAN